MGGCQDPHHHCMGLSTTERAACTDSCVFTPISWRAPFRHLGHCLRFCVAAKYLHGIKAAQHQPFVAKLPSGSHLDSPRLLWWSLLHGCAGAVCRGYTMDRYEPKIYALYHSRFRQVRPPGQLNSQQPQQ
jgi:hypothetical protein